MTSTKAFPVHPGEAEVQWQCRKEWRACPLKHHKWHHYSTMSSGDAATFMAKKSQHSSIFVFRINPHPKIITEQVTTTH